VKIDVYIAIYTWFVDIADASFGTMSVSHRAKVYGESLQ